MDNIFDFVKKRLNRVNDDLWQSQPWLNIIWTNRRYTPKIGCQKKFQILKIYRNTPQRETQNEQGQMNKYQQPPESNLMVNLVITFILTFDIFLFGLTGIAFLLANQR